MAKLIRSERTKTFSQKTEVLKSYRGFHITKYIYYSRGARMKRTDYEAGGGLVNNYKRFTATTLKDLRDKINYFHKHKR
jgi:hypothetical protein